MSKIPEVKHYENRSRSIMGTIKKLKLRPELPLSDFVKKNKRFFSTPCQTKNGRMVFLKILLSQRKQDALGLKKEVKITKFLSQFARKNKNLNIPLFVDAQTKEKPYWFVHQYLPGPLLGYHFEIFKTGLKKQVREKIVDNLLALQSLPIPEIGLLIKNKVKLNNNNLVLSHGDFTLANFFLHKGQVYLTDWELACIDNMAADIARLWIQTYKYPAWRRQLILYFASKLGKKKRQGFKELFRLMAIIEAKKEMRCGIAPKKMRQTIEAAKKGFDNLMNL